MGIKSFMKNFVLKMDILSAQTQLRANGNSAFQTFCGGILSIIIIIAFAAIFYSSFASVIDRLSITYTQTFEDDPTSSTSINSVMIAVGVNGLDLSAAPKKLHVTLDQVSVMPSGSVLKPIKLSTCNQTDWAPLGNNFDKQFKGFKFNEMLCITKNEAYSMFGYSGTLPYQFLSMKIVLCAVGISGCDTVANSLSWLTTKLTLTSISYIPIRLYIVNTIVSPSKPNPTSNIIQKDIIVTFSQTTGTLGYVFIGDFTILTDNSILPYTDYTTNTGTFVDTYTTTTVPLTNIATQHILKFQFYKSTKSLTVARTYGKLDALLSYAGGLFSLLFSVIAFFFASYSQYCYEIYIAQSLLSLDRSGKKFKERQFNFLIYLKYCFYDWLGTVGIHPQWQRENKIAEIKSQANNLMSIPLILKRIQHLENISHILLQEHKILAIQLSASPTLEEAKKMRETVTFYDELLARIEENRQNTAQNFAINLKQINNQHVTKQFMDVNETGYQSNENNRGESKQLFNEQNEIDRKFLEALRWLKSQNDEQSVKIKQKLLLEVWQKINDEASPLRESKEFMMLSLQSKGDF